MHKSLRAIHAHIQRLGNHSHVHKVANHFHTHRKKYLALNVIASLFFIALSFAVAPQNKTFAASGSLVFIQTDPDHENGSVTASLNSPVYLVFNENLDASSVTTGGFSNVVPGDQGSGDGGVPTNIALTQNGSPVTGTISYYYYAGMGSRVYLFNPTSSLNPSTTYTVTLTGGSSGITASNGADWLATDASWSFTTGGVPTVTSVSPSAGQLQAHGSSYTQTPSSVTVNFSETMNSNTITTSSFHVYAGGNPVSGSVSYNPQTNVATFTPNSAFAFGTGFLVELDAEGTGSPIMSAQGVAIQPNNTPEIYRYGFYFTTIGSGTPYLDDEVQSAVSPSRGETNVQLNSAVTVHFNTSMDPSTINSNTFTVYDGDAGHPNTPGVITGSGNDFTFTPTNNLTANTTYTVTLTTGVATWYPVNMANNYYWTFTTVGVDSTPPNVGIHTPIDTVTPVNESTTTFIRAYFENGPIDSDTVNSDTFTVSGPSGALIPSSVVFSGGGSDYATFNLGSPLAAHSTYTVTLHGGPSGIKDLQGNEMIEDYTWSFHTTDARPGITTVSPTSGEVGVSTGATVSVVFDTNVTGVDGSTFYLRKTQDDSAVATTVGTSSSTSYSLTPNSALLPSTQYTVYVTAGITDAYSYPIIASQWNFITGGGGGGGGGGSYLSNPSSVSPTVAASDVATSANITATFAENIDASTVGNDINGIYTFYVQTSNGQSMVDVSGTVSVDGTGLTFTPSPVLTQGTLYQVTITTGVQGQVSGNSLASNYSWSFTTASGGGGCIDTAMDLSPMMSGGVVDIPEGGCFEITSGAGSGSKVDLAAGASFGPNGWNGNMGISYSTSIADGVSLSSAEMVGVTLGGVNETVGLNEAAVVTIPYAAFNPATKSVIISDPDGNSGTSQCTIGEYPSDGPKDTAGSYSLEGYGTAGKLDCYTYDSNNVYVATNHFSDFYVGGQGDSNPVPEFSTYMYIFTVCAGAWMMQRKYIGFQK